MTDCADEAAAVLADLALIERQLRTDELVKRAYVGMLVGRQPGQIEPDIWDWSARMAPRALFFTLAMLGIAILMPDGAGWSELIGVAALWCGGVGFGLWWR